MNRIELYNQYNELLEVLIVDDFNNNQELEELIVDVCTIDENEIDYYKVVDKEIQNSTSKLKISSKQSIYFSQTKIDVSKII